MIHIGILFVCFFFLQKSTFTVASNFSKVLVKSKKKLLAKALTN